MKNIQSEIKKSLDLLKDVKIQNYKIDSVGLGTDSTQEYDQLAEDILKISKDSKEVDNTLFVSLSSKIENIEYVRVSKPESKNDISLQVDDIEIAKTQYPDGKYIEGEGWKLIEIKSENGTIYISNISESEHYFQTKEVEADNANSGEDQDLKNLLEEEKKRRISLMADFQNYQRRVEQDKATWGAMSNMSLIKDILEIYDDLELAINDDTLDLNAAKVSITSAQDKLIDAVKRSGIEKIEVKVGDAFDKEKMEAVSAVSVQDESQKGKVIAVISSAYKYTSKEFILKAAKVVVGK